MRARRILMAAILAGLSWACDTREAYPDPGLLPAIVLDVANENAHDIDVYALQGGQRLRVAHLWAGENGVMEIGPPLVETGDFVLEAYAIGLDSSYRTPPVAIMGQMHIQLRIDRELTGSTFSVTYGADPDSIPLLTGGTL